MQNDIITFQNSGYFTPIVLDYLQQQSSLKSLCSRFPTIENFEFQIQEKKANFNENEISKRSVLVDVLKKSYSGLNATDATLANIDLLKHEYFYNYNWSSTQFIYWAIVFFIQNYFDHKLV